ncbi:MAG: flagellar hook-associated protein FlgK [Hirschia sp.]|nr:flagellar hook-associated protein FlgK [Hirschia sp.]MBF17689.1 flagellar hook-associated protein FlgK [Hirschia sp.]MBF20261.1 flagellar hook-associated protein FlgK [Hirschia sp.]
MSLSSIMSSSLSALQANQAALRATSNNVANVNTEGYTRVDAAFVSRSATGGTSGVEVDFTRAVSTYLAAAEMRAASNFSAAEIEADFMDRAQGLLGDPSDGGSVFAALDTVLDAFGVLSNDPSDVLRRADVVASLGALTGQLDQTSREIQALRDEADMRLKSSVEDANSLMQGIADLNESIQRARVSGSDSTEAETQQSRLLDQLSSFIDIRTQERSTGGVDVRTTDGFILVNSQAARISVDTETENSEGYGGLQVLQPHATSPIDLESHINSGELAGLLKLRDGELADLASSFGEYAAGVVDSLNAAHNDASAVPALNTMTGTNTGLLATDAHGFTGTAHMAIVGTDGAIDANLEINFTTGLITDPAGTTLASMGANASIADLRDAMNTALGGSATVSFAEGRMTIQSASADTGIVIRQDEASPSDRAGKGFSHAFGLNNIIGRDAPISSATGLTTGSPLGLTAGETMLFDIRDRDGALLRQAEITIQASDTTIGDLVSSINSEIAGFGTASLDDNGQLVFSSNVGSKAGDFNVVRDTTQRGDTGLSISQIFSLGVSVQSRRAQGLEVREDIASDPQKIAAAAPDIDGAAIGSVVLGPGDGRGATALESSSSVFMSFGKAGGLSSQTGTITNYAARLAGYAGSRASSAENAVVAAESLKNEVGMRRESVEGVNLDEELVKMTQYQQAYSAASRMIQAAQELYDTLLSMV